MECISLGTISKFRPFLVELHVLSSVEA